MRRSPSISRPLLSRGRPGRAKAGVGAGVFALGFFMRPIGGWLFGYIGDHYGREESLMLSVLMMCAGSLAIAVTPGYAQIGVWAPTLLMLAPHGPGPQPRRRIWRQRHLCRGNGRFRPARLLFQLSLCDADRRPTRRARRAADPAEPAADAGAIARLGLAHSLRHRRGPRAVRACGCGATSRRRRPSRPPRRRRQEGGAARAVGASARGADRDRPDHGRHAGLLCLHDLHAEIPQADGRADGCPDAPGSARPRWFSPCACSRSMARSRTASAAARCCSPSASWARSARCR